MIHEFTIPKHEFMAEVDLLDQPRARVTMFLGECASAHAGCERPSDLLNREEDFLPSLDQEGRYMALNRETIRMVSVSWEDEYGERGCPPDPGPTSVAPVDVLLVGGLHVIGEIHYQMPEARRRIQDYLNTDFRFLPVHENDVIHFINRKYILKLASMGRMGCAQ